mmetsp:Transcript_3098/g.6837  ORF Transcript_3098/g.6837 Transcript_3098/m.6837 type:complete len:280 (-) Transcript_3098:316-1155(-)
MTAGNLGFDGNVVLKLSRGKINIDHHSRPETSLLHNIRLVQINNTSFTHHVHGTIIGDGITRRSQPIPVQRCSNGLSVTVHKKCGSIPRLQQSTMEFVKVHDLGIVAQRWLVLVRSGHQTHERAGSAMATLGHELEDGIQVGGIGSSQVHERLEEVGHVLGIAHHDNVVGVLGSHQVLQFLLGQGLGLLARLHPVDITDEGVDLSIVSHDAHGLGERPLGVGVGTETTMVNDEFGGEVLVLQILVKLGKDASLHHALVHDGLAGEGGEVDLFASVLLLQ